MTVVIDFDEDDDDDDDDDDHDDHDDHDLDDDDDDDHDHEHDVNELIYLIVLKDSLHFHVAAAAVAGVSNAQKEIEPYKVTITLRCKHQTDISLIACSLIYLVSCFD